ncbi:MAG TPA: MOSC domain-containing protein [Acidimicrobiia bacterium]
MDEAVLRSVNVGTPRTVAWHGRSVTSAIWKSPVEGRVRVEGVQVDGDAQADLRVHGGTHKSVYAYAVEDYEWWAAQLGTAFSPATFGENLTTAGLVLDRCVVGERWRVGSALLEVSEPRMPCFKLGIRMGDADFVDRFEEARRPGTYLRIARAGDVGAGDAINVVHRPDHGLTIGELMAAQLDGDERLLARVIDNPDVSPSWAGAAARRLERSRQ